MRFVAPSIPQLINKNRPADEETIEPHLLSTLEMSDGSCNIRTLLLELQNAVDQYGQIQDQFGVMMSMDPQTGALMVTVIRSPKEKAQRPEANLTIMKEAIKQYELEHSQTMSTFQRGTQSIRNNLKAYKEYVEMNRENCILNLVSRNIKKLVTAKGDQQSCDRKTSISSETEDERELQEKDQAKLQKQGVKSIEKQNICPGQELRAENRSTV